MAYEESNGHVSDRCRHVTPKGQVVIPIRLESDIAKTAGDAI